MRTARLNDMTRGWFVGNFSPTLLATEAAEVAVKEYVPGDYEPAHYHKIATEITVIRVFDLPDGRRRVRLYSDHPLRLYDKTDPPGSDAHPFGFLELTADASGSGTGELIAAGSMTFNDDGLRIDSAGTPLIKIVDVTTDRPPAPPPQP